jgi:hypothetical protein
MPVSGTNLDGVWKHKGGTFWGIRLCDGGAIHCPAGRSIRTDGYDDEEFVKEWPDRRNRRKFEWPCAKDQDNQDPNGNYGLNASGKWMAAPGSYGPWPGDVKLGLALDCDKGTLTVFINEAKLGIACDVPTNEPLCFAVLLRKAGEKVLIISRLDLVNRSHDKMSAKVSMRGVRQVVGVALRAKIFTK